MSIFICVIGGTIFNYIENQIIISYVREKENGKRERENRK